MGEAKRRRLAEVQGLAVVKPEPKPIVEILRMVKLKRIEETDEDGIVYARTLFRVVNDQGKTMMEMVDGSPMPVVLASLPQPIKRAVLATIARV